MNENKLTLTVIATSLLLGSIIGGVHCKLNREELGNERVSFAYTMLSQDSLESKLIEPAMFSLISEKKIPLDSNHSQTEWKYLVDKEFNIMYTRHTGYISSLKSEFKRDELQILNRTFVIDSLFYGEDFDGNSDAPSVSTLNKVYQFTFQHRQYFCFFIQDVTNPTSMLNTDIFLIEVVNYRAIPILSALQASENLRCFGDFNKDNKLDFASWCFGYSFQDTLELYELNQEKFILNPAKYLIIEDTGNEYLVNTRKSRWFSNSLFKN